MAAEGEPGAVEEELTLENESTNHKKKKKKKFTEINI